MVILCKPMEFVWIDIAHMPVDNDGYGYFLLIGDLFSKFIDAVPLRDQMAQSIIKAVASKWLYMHSNQYCLMSDQGSNVDMDAICKFSMNLKLKRGVSRRTTVRATWKGTSVMLRTQKHKSCKVAKAITKTHICL